MKYILNTLSVLQHVNGTPHVPVDNYRDSMMMAFMVSWNMENW